MEYVLMNNLQTADALMGIFNFKRVKPTPKKAKPKKKRQTPLPTLIAKADKVTSTYIRQKYADHAGNVTCITCGKVLPWQSAHCAHFIGRGSKGTRWLEENLHPACPGCNCYRPEVHLREYTLFIIDTYGREKVTELKQIASEVLSGSQVRQLAEEAIDYYSTELKGMS
jgi:hypothetical protein